MTALLLFLTIACVLCPVDSIDLGLSFSSSMAREITTPSRRLFGSIDDDDCQATSLVSSRARIVISEDRAEIVSDDDEGFIISEHGALFDQEIDGISPLAWSSANARAPVNLALRLPLDQPHVRGDSTPNNMMASLPSMGRTKTGTTIVGIYIDGGSINVIDGDGDSSMIVLAADTRATAGRLVADKRADKIHALTPHSSRVAAFACGAGTSADLDKITRQCYYSMQLQEKEYDSIGQEHYNADNTFHMRDNISVCPIQFDMLCQFLQDLLYQQGGRCGANLIVGGASNGKCYLRAIHPHGSMDRLESFSALGSGGLAAMAVLENEYKRNLTKDDAIALAKKAILAGIDNDLGSGSMVDLCIIYSSGRVEQMRAAVPEQQLEALTKTSRNSDSNNQSTARGVNGFGSVPFTIQSRREIRIQPGNSEDEWSQALGL